MNTSIYFLLWFGVYLLLGVLGLGGDNSFFIALALVFVTSMLFQKVFHNRLLFLARKQLAETLEIYYTDNVKAMLSRIRKSLIFDICSAIYLFIGTAVILITHSGLTVVIIFGIFTFLSIKGAVRKRNLCKEIKEEGLPEQPAEFYDELGRYAQMRQSGYTAAQIEPKPTGWDTAFKWGNIICAALCILLGMFMSGINLIGLLADSDPSAHPFYALNLTWGFLAIIYGIGDLIGAARN